MDRTGTPTLKIGIVRLLEDDSEDREVITRALLKHGMKDMIDFFFYKSTADLNSQMDDDTFVIALDNRIEGEVTTGIDLMRSIRGTIKRPLDIIICSGAFTPDLYQTVNNYKGYVVIKSIGDDWADNLALTILRSREHISMLMALEKQINDIKERDKKLFDERSRSQRAI